MREKKIAERKKERKTDYYRDGGDFSGQHKHVFMTMMIATTRERETTERERKGFQSKRERKNMVGQPLHEKKITTLFVLLEKNRRDMHSKVVDRKKREEGRQVKGRGRKIISSPFFFLSRILLMFVIPVH